MLPLDFWVFLVVFSLGGHDIDTYRTVSVGGGAFELCLPSLGSFLTKLTLRSQLLGQPNRMTKVRTLAERDDLEHDKVPDLSSSLSRSGSVGVGRPNSMLSRLPEF